MSDMKLELVPVPVADVDLAKTFYTEKLGFRADHDVAPAPGRRVLQLTPPGSACSILLSTGLGDISGMTPGSVKGLHLVVGDVAAMREELIGRGVEVKPMVEYPGGIRIAHFADPDGNTWLLQELPKRG